MAVVNCQDYLLEEEARMLLLQPMAAATGTYIHDPASYDDNAGCKAEHTRHTQAAKLSLAVSKPSTCGAS